MSKKIRTYIAKIKLNGEQVKSLPSITMSEDNSVALEELKEKMLKYHQMEFGVHYDDVEFDFTKEEELPSKNKKEPVVEKPVEPSAESVPEEVEFSEEHEPVEVVETVEAEVVEEPSELKETSLEINFPAIPDKFFIETDKEIREYSLEVVAQREKEAEELLAQATPENYGNDKLFAKIDRLKKDMVKERTNPLNYFKTKIDKPVKNFLKDTQSKVEAIGDRAKEVQDRLDKAIQDRDNYVAEQERLEDERKTKLALDRATKLQSVGGIYDPVSKSVTVDGIGLFLDEQLRTVSDEDFEKDLASATSLFEANQQKKEAESAELEQTKKILLKYRTRDLSDAGFAMANGTWARGSQSITTEQITSMSEDDFESFLEAPKESAQEAKKEETATNLPEIEITSYSTPKQAETDVVPDKVVLDFTESGYIDIMFVKTMMRIYPIGNDDIALAGLEKDKVLAPSVNEDLGLKFVPCKL